MLSGSTGRLVLVRSLEKFIGSWAYILSLLSGLTRRSTIPQTLKKYQSIILIVAVGLGLSFGGAW